MPKIPLEDNIGDVIKKAQRNASLSDRALAEETQIPVDKIIAVKEGSNDIETIRVIARPLKLNISAAIALAKKTWYPEQVLFSRGFAMFNTTFEDMTVNSYLIWDPKTRRAAAFDTGATVESMLLTIEAENLTLESIFLSHSHDDHVADLGTLIEKTGAVAYISEKEPFPPAIPFKENAVFHLDSITIKTMSTWGHSLGGTTYVVQGLPHPLAIVGDSLFASSMGGGVVSTEAAYRNNVEKIFTLTDNTVLACGHGPLTTVGQEKKHNPFFAK